MVKYDFVKKIVLIGGGDLLLHAAQVARQLGYSTSVVVAQRHSEERLLLEKSSLVTALRTKNIDAHVVHDINNWPRLNALTNDEDTLGIGFGPAWVFSPRTRSTFQYGMINFHGIPSPRYLGGAHATWQIMNNDRSGGCIIQRIEDRLDRGAILRSEYFNIPDSLRIPIEYQVEGLNKGKTFIDKFLKDAASGVPFEARPFATLEKQRLYFPRLFTPVSAYIDWNWQANQIERFICAFDQPYPGARTFVDDTLIVLRSAFLEPSETELHPFTAGLIVRRHEGKIWVAANRGLLRIDSVTFADERNAYGYLKEGARLHTPIAVSEKAKVNDMRLTASGFETSEDQ